MNTYRFDLILEDCLSRIDRGEKLQDILDSYPKLEGRLEPLVQAALTGRMQPKPVPSSGAIRIGKNTMLAELSALKGKDSHKKKETILVTERKPVRWLEQFADLILRRTGSGLNPVYRLVIVGIFLLLVGSAFTINASASSLPGDRLYDLKLNLEKVRMVLVFNPESRQELAKKFEEKRRLEVEQLLEEGQVQQVAFFGTIDKMDFSIRSISGVPVKLGPEVELKGDIEEGTEVVVAAVTQEDGTVLATKISKAVEVGDEADLTSDEEPGVTVDDEDKDKEEKDKEDKEKEDKDKEDKDKEDKDKEDKDKEDKEKEDKDKEDKEKEDKDKEDKEKEDKDKEDKDKEDKEKEDKEKEDKEKEDKEKEDKDKDK